MEFINIIIFSSYKGVASSEFLGLHHTFQRLRLRHKFTLDKALRRGLKGRCVAWDVSPVAPTPFRFLLLFFLCVCVCVCVCVCCITNLYCLSLEEHPIKLWKKKEHLRMRLIKSESGCNKAANCCPLNLQT